MKLRVTTPARREYQEAANYLIEHSPPAARQFVEIIEAAFRNLRDNPNMGRKVDEKGVRALVLSSVPYKIFYRIDGDTIMVASIFHTSREPE